MRSGWQVGSLFGIPFFIDPSWGVILAFVTFTNSMNYLQAGLAIEVAWGAGLVMALLLFASVLLHELGHSLVAMAQGIKVNSITLFLFGGVAAIERESNTPGQAFQVAIAGPLVSVLLFALFKLAASFVSGPIAVVAMSLSRINLVLALFNLVPGLPLDGGQILKAALWKITGNRLQAVKWAALGGQIIGWLGIVFGLFLILFTGGAGGSFWLTVIAWFILRNATNYRRITSLQESLLKATAGDAMTRDFRVVETKQTLHQFAETYLLQTAEASDKGFLHQYIYYAASEGRYQGLVQMEDLQTIERSRWETETLHYLVHSLQSIPTVRETTPLATVVNLMEEKQLSYLTVLSPADAVAGVIDRGDIVRAVAKQLSTELSDEVIQQIKQTGTYPSDLPLPSLARSVMPIMDPKIDAV